MVAALVLWCANAWGATWTPKAPGAGGNFPCVSVSTGGNGAVLVASDVSGMYRRTSNTADWTRVGNLDGLEATTVYSVRFKPGSNDRAIAGTGRGIHYSSNGGASWTRPPSGNADRPPTSHNLVAVGWACDAGVDVAFCAYNNGTTTTDSALIRVSTNNGVAWFEPKTVVVESFSAGNDPEMQPIKIATDPQTSGSTRVVYVLLGINLKSEADDLSKEVAYDTTSQHFPPRYRRLYRSGDNGDTWSFIHGGVVDFAIDSSGSAHDLAIALSGSGFSKNNASGGIKTTTDASQATISWNTPESIDSNLPVGAIWYKNGNLHMLTIQDDPCGSASNDGAGVWVKNGSWSRVDDGRNSGSWGGSVVDAWESGWSVVGSGDVPCGYRYGQPVANSALGVSERGEYRVTTSFVWHYDWGAASGRGYRSSFTNSGPGPYTGKRIDNTNPAFILVDGTDVWTGFYDIGLWKLTSSGWENHNWDADKNTSGHWGWEGNGGNVNGIVKVGSTMYVSGAKSSKGTDWNIYKNTASNFPANGWSMTKDFTDEYVRGLSYHSNSSKLWVTHGGKVAYSTDGTTWTDGATSGGQPGGDLSPDPIYTTTLGGNGNVVLAGAVNGIWYNNNNGANDSWSHALDLGANSGDQGDIKHTEDWTGVHELYYDSEGGRYYATVYAPYNATPGTWYGVYQSSDGSTWRMISPTPDDDPFVDNKLRRGVYVDSCGLRVHITSSYGFSSGPNSTSGQFDQANGCQTCRFANGNPATGALVCDDEIPTTEPTYRNRFGGRISMYRSTSAGVLYVGAQGYGLMQYSLNQPSSCGGGGGCEEPCETDLGGGEGEGAGGEVVASPRTHYLVAEVGQLFVAPEDREVTVYDISGRSVKSPGPGVYFVVTRTKSGALVSRRTVVVTH